MAGETSVRNNVVNTPRCQGQPGVAMGFDLIVMTEGDPARQRTVPLPAKVHALREMAPRSRRAHSGGGSQCISRCAPPGMRWASR